MHPQCLVSSLAMASMKNPWNYQTVHALLDLHWLHSLSIVLHSYHRYYLVIVDLMMVRWVVTVVPFDPDNVEPILWNFEHFKLNRFVSLDNCFVAFLSKLGKNNILNEQQYSQSNTVQWKIFILKMLESKLKYRKNKKILKLNKNMSLCIKQYVKLNWKPLRKYEKLQNPTIFSLWK